MNVVQVTEGDYSVVLADTPILYVRHIVSCSHCPGHWCCTECDIDYFKIDGALEHLRLNHEGV